MKTDPIALTFLSDVSVAPDLGLHYSKKLQEWIDEETNDDDIRAWFDNLGYPLANPNLLESSEEFRKMLHYWNGFYTVAVDGKYISLCISEDRVGIDGHSIIDCHFSKDILTWSRGMLHFEMVMNTDYPKLVGKLVRGKLAKNDVLPKTENVYGSTIIMASTGDAGSSNLKSPHFTALDFFNGQYVLLPLKSELDLPPYLTMDLSGEIGLLGLNTLGSRIDYSNFNALPEAGQNGKWNENALVFYHSESKYYGKIQFIVGPMKNKEGKTELAKGFFGAITTDRDKLDVPNVIGIFHAEKQPGLKKGVDSDDANKSSVAGTVLAGVALLVAAGFFIWEQVKAKKGDSAEIKRANKLDEHIEALKTQLEKIQSNTVDTPKIDLKKAKAEIAAKEIRKSELDDQLQSKKQEKDSVTAEIERIKSVKGYDPLKKNKKLEKKIQELEKVEDSITEWETEKKSIKEDMDTIQEAIKKERQREAREKCR